MLGWLLVCWDGCLGVGMDVWMVVSVLGWLFGWLNGWKKINNGWKKVIFPNGWKKIYAIIKH
jgi:hypothetical protein